MTIKYIAWGKVICSDVNRLIYGTQGPGLHNKADQAIQKFNTRDENPGLWSGFTAGATIPSDGIKIELTNSVNSLKIWGSTNAGRADPIKINHQIWDRKNGHDKLIIETWYLGYMRILEQLLLKAKEKSPTNNNVDILLGYVSRRLALDTEINTNLLKWIYDTQDGFAALTLDTSFMRNEHIGDINHFVEDYFYIVVKCDNDGNEINMALMANSKSENLHPEIKQLLLSKPRGGKNVNINMAMGSPSSEAQYVLNILREHKNIILYGPPGTGKTHMLIDLMNSFNCNAVYDNLDTEAPIKIVEESNSGEVKWCTFHPNYSYENFVHGIKPIVIGGNLGFEPYVGPFLKQALVAESGTNALLIIDEINRAKTDDVFGATISLLDRDINEKVTLTHPIIAEGVEIHEINSSDNFYVVGTMNSLDKNTTPLSRELKRRFTIIEISPSTEVLRHNLDTNESIDDDLKEFCCALMENLNNKIHKYCGKEFELGQGYFWGLVEAQDKHYSVMADIIVNKIAPHLRDTLPVEFLNDFFGSNNLNVLFEQNTLGFDFIDISDKSDSYIINAYATVIDSHFRYDEDCIDEDDENQVATFEEYELAKITNIYEKLRRYKNVILTGCSGTGKTYIVNKIVQMGLFGETLKMHWHSSTEYADVIEGISATINGNQIEYSIMPGMVRQLAAKQGSKLMVIEGLNKSNAAENFGELITLLEPDKRNLGIEGYDGTISIPEDMHFICTMNPNVENQYKLDSAMKRRFIIINLNPDYDLLALHFGISDYKKTLILNDVNIFSDEDVYCLAIQLLKRLNEKISSALGNDFRVGHAVLWNLCNHSSVLCKLKEILDYLIIPQIEEYCYDEDIVHKLFGHSSPIFSVESHGIEIQHFTSLSDDKFIEALKGLLDNE